jgi:hypothetical protein
MHCISLPFLETETKRLYKLCETGERKRSPPQNRPNRAALRLGTMLDQPIVPFAHAHRGREFCWWNRTLNSPAPWHVRYVRVFKSNTEGICAQRGMRTGHMPQHVCKGQRDTDARQAFTFTFVRSPLSHFLSGYSEIVFRARGWQRKQYEACAARGCFTWLRRGLSEDERALAFVDDFIAGRVASQCCPYTAQAGDLHAVPQTAFITSALINRYACPVGRVDFIGKLEHLADDWANISRTIPGFESYDVHRAPNPHKQTNAASNNPWRSAMETLLESDALMGPQRRDSLCRNLSVDYRCFGYSPEKLCTNASASVMRTPCPLKNGRLVPWLTHPNGAQWAGRQAAPPTTSEVSSIVPEEMQMASQEWHEEYVYDPDV